MSEMQRSWPAPLNVDTGKPIQPWIWIAVGCLVVLLLAGGAWGGLRAWRAFQGAGREQITLLHKHMAEQDPGAIFAEADPDYQDQVGREHSDAIFAVVHDHLGDPVSYSVSNVNVATTPNAGTTKSLVLETQFTKGSGVESLKYHKVNGVWRMTAYHCVSALLKGVNLDFTKK